MPAGALAAGSTTPTSSQITPTPPARLATTSASATSATTTGTSDHRGTLPDTGYDLLPETVLGLTLVAVGVGLRVRRART